jgi:hypothetical protein
MQSARTMTSLTDDDAISFQRLMEYKNCEFGSVREDKDTTQNPYGNLGSGIAM